jgi:K+-transporting ATPase KdpF subunit
VNLNYLINGIIAFALIVCLGYVLLRPDKF